ncbi:Uncharacterized protein YNL050C [Sugiyamaella lignohabitans]|uniref:Uncharacterized protein YNL050C n=1 Tax=Sugiyamaella lignohabitans TaxID=796027 RepID=A0A167D648_9ASCO|nr:Uncharacterized protein YNL050C [Sugiyamaella lignohabitans]ANB12529.1 Uncharacterized protein YNL050C [Sugiyamaella lignohabitans]
MKKQANRLDVPSDSVRVSRKDLYRQNEEDESMSDGNGEDGASFVPDLEFTAVDVDLEAGSNDELGQEDQEEDGYFFPLFGGGVSSAAGSKKADAETAAADGDSGDKVLEKPAESVTRVIIKEDEDEEAVSRERPDSYYIYKPDELKRAEFESMAVSGEFVLQNSSVPLPGMRLPGRVIDYTALAEQVKLDNRKRRARPGKKTREERKLHPRKRPPPSGSAVYGHTRTYGSSNLPYHTEAKKPPRNFTKSSRGGSAGRGRGAARGSFRGGRGRGRGRGN